jgi:hypothetical protein
MSKEVEIRHYNRYGKIVKPNDVRGLYVLKIVWYRSGNNLQRTEKSGWLKAAPEQEKDFKTWQELWDWVEQVQTGARHRRHR